jgi:hypothetical protein
MRVIKLLSLASLSCMIYGSSTAQEATQSGAAPSTEQPAAAPEPSTGSSTTGSATVPEPQAESTGSHPGGNTTASGSGAETSRTDPAQEHKPSANTEGQPGVNAEPLSSGPPQDKAVRDTVDNMRDVVKQTARQHIKESAAEATEGTARVTSEDRPSGPLKSSAHDRGAVDFQTPGNSDADAEKISRAAGPGHTAIVETPLHPAPGAEGPSADKHKSYSNGIEGNTKITAPRATGPHIHVQPDYGIKQWPSSSTNTNR